MSERTTKVTRSNKSSAADGGTATSRKSIFSSPIPNLGFVAAENGHVRRQAIVQNGRISTIPEFHTKPKKGSQFSRHATSYSSNSKQHQTNDAGVSKRFEKPQSRRSLAHEHEEEEEVFNDNEKYDDERSPASDQSYYGESNDGSYKRYSDSAEEDEEEGDSPSSSCTRDTFAISPARVSRMVQHNNDVVALNEFCLEFDVAYGALNRYTSNNDKTVISGDTYIKTRVIRDIIMGHISPNRERCIADLRSALVNCYAQYTDIEYKVTVHEVNADLYLCKPRVAIRFALEKISSSPAQKTADGDYDDDERKVQVDYSPNYDLTVVTVNDHVSTTKLMGKLVKIINDKLKIFLATNTNSHVRSTTSKTRRTAAR
ncbi:hypothetical protein [Heliothis virescens ascovirus 3g]|uniref:Uncharacterized protein n=1 Tax=Heliothis virescens ascovirus 3g TaxID=1246651 RepID=K4NVY6_9VIRU|nr:hypothetical protein F8204_gp076 [Heliothis virescens ascovirus 3g]AFV50328.1 hypothetical protein [Heliothis virescens ascovirus 3g]